jgi:hypothetical protein
MAASFYTMAIYVDTSTSPYDNASCNKTPANIFHQGPLALSMELCFDSTISKTIYLQLESKSRTFNDHLEREVQIVELNPPSRCQPREQTLRYCAQVGSERTHVYKISRIGCRWFSVGIGGNEIIGDYEGLSRSVKRQSYIWTFVKYRIYLKFRV